MPHYSHYVPWVDPSPEEPIEIVESIELEGPIEEVPAPVRRTEQAVEPAGLSLESPVEPDEISAPASPAAATVAPNGVAVPLESGIVPSAAATDDPYGVFLQALAVVSREGGYPFATTEIASALAGDDVARAWCAILRGESEDFSLCGTPLDEWASQTLARIADAPQKAAQFRRDLRSRGVAAFGLVEAA